jgi:hypothetical protein
MADQPLTHDRFPPAFTHTIRTSESVNQLFAARVAFAEKGIEFLAESTNPHFGNPYATLPFVLNKTMKPLAECGLTVIQGATLLNGEFAVITRLVHTSGEWMETLLPIPPSAKALDRDASQAILSAYTYGRRGSLLALLGLAPVDPKEQNLLEVDDDGNTAAGKHLQPPKPVTQTAKPAPAKSNGSVISKPQAKRLYAIAKSHEVDVDSFQAYLKETYGYERFSDIDRSKYEEIVKLAESGTAFRATVEELTEKDIVF